MITFFVCSGTPDCSFLTGLGLILGRRIVQSTVRPIRAGHAKKADHWDPVYGHFQLPTVNPIHKYVGKGMGTIMWFWILYRGYHDIPKMIDPPFMHDDDDDDHGHGH